MHKAKSLTPAQKQSGEITHVKWEAPLYRRLKLISEKERRTIVNFIQVAVIEALEKRNG